MKILIGAVIGLVGSAVVIFLDIKFIQWCFTCIPTNEWAKLIKIAIVFIDFWFTAGLCILPFVAGIIIGGIFEEAK